MPVSPFSTFLACPHDDGAAKRGRTVSLQDQTGSFEICAHQGRCASTIIVFARLCLPAAVWRLPGAMRPSNARSME